MKGNKDIATLITDAEADRILFKHGYADPEAIDALEKRIASSAGAMVGEREHNIGDDSLSPLDAASAPPEEGLISEDDADEILRAHGYGSEDIVALENRLLSIAERLTSSVKSGAIEVGGANVRSRDANQRYEINAHPIAGSVTIGSTEWGKSICASTYAALLRKSYRELTNWPYDSPHRLDMNLGSSSGLEGAFRQIDMNLAAATHGVRALSTQHLSDLFARIIESGISDPDSWPAAVDVKAFDTLAAAAFSIRTLLTDVESSKRFGSGTFEAACSLANVITSTRLVALDTRSTCHMSDFVWSANVARMCMNPCSAAGENEPVLFEAKELGEWSQEVLAHVQLDQWERWLLRMTYQGYSFIDIGNRARISSLAVKDGVHAIRRRRGQPNLVAMFDELVESGSMTEESLSEGAGVRAATRGGEKLILPGGRLITPGEIRTTVGI